MLNKMRFTMNQLVPPSRPGVCVFVMGALLASMILTGCNGGKVLRENVLATTQSTIGISLAQNPQTQVHELKAGFVRNEFFLVPTSKRVVYDENNKDAAGTGTATATTDGTGNKTTRSSNYDKGVEHNDPTGTPEVLAEIQVGGKGKQSIGTSPEQGADVEVYQRLAVGKIAVQSGAAVALMSQDAKTAEAVRQKALIQDQPEYLAAVRVAYSVINGLVQKGNADAAKAKASLDPLGKLLLPTTFQFRQFSESMPPNTFLSVPATKAGYPAVPNASFDDAVDYLAILDNSIQTVEDLLKRNSAITLNGSPLTPLDYKELGEELAFMKSHRTALNNIFNARSELRQAMELVFGFKSSK